MSTKSTLVPLENYLTDVTHDERVLIDQEKRYYEIAVALKNKRESLGLSQQELAARANMPRTTVTKVESGNRNTTLKTLMALAKAMDSTFELRLR